MVAKYENGCKMCEVTERCYSTIINYICQYSTWKALSSFWYTSGPSLNQQLCILICFIYWYVVYSGLLCILVHGCSLVSSSVYSFKHASLSYLIVMCFRSMSELWVSYMWTISELSDNTRTSCWLRNSSFGDSSRFSKILNY